MTAIQFDINEFHPALRQAMGKEIARIQRDTPPFWGSVSVSVKDTIPSRKCPSCGQRHAHNALKRSFAVTVFEVKDKSNSIVFNSELFGVDSNHSALLKGLDEDKNHGGLSREPAYVLTHEYGHVMDNMISMTFGMEETPELDALIKAGKPLPYTNDVAKDYDSLFSFVSHSVDPFMGLLRQILIGEIPFNAKEDLLVSAYSYTNPNEMFADTFAAFYHGDPDQKGKKVTHMMGDLIKVTYAELKKGDGNAKTISEPL